jgi:putative cell wall-binding protein
VRTLGARDRSTERATVRRRLAAGTALAVASATAVVLGTSVPAFASTVTAVTGAATPGSQGATAQYAITFTATSPLVAGVGTITINEPAGTNTPAVASDYEVNGSLLLINPVVTGGVGGTITLTTPVNITAGQAVVVGAVNITNPFAGPQTLTVSTSSDVTPASNTTPYAITPPGGSQVTNVSAGTAPTTAGATAAYTVSFLATTALTAGSGTITLNGPSGTTFPQTAGNYTVNGTAVSAAPSGSGATVTVTTPVGVAAGGAVIVHATGVTNPAAGIHTLTVATSTDPLVSASGFYFMSGGSGSGGGSSPLTPVRLFGADRFGTAIAASLAEFPTAHSAGAVVLARSDDYPDALVGTALAAAKHAPLLFASGGTLTAATVTEIQRVIPAGGTVYLLGGTSAIPINVAGTLNALGFTATRYFGSDRFGTALAVAAALGNPTTVLLATGINFPDALAAGPAAAHVGGVVLLTNGTSLTSSVQAYLTAHPGKVYAVGGPAVTADPAAIPLTGSDRYGTATAVAAALYSGPTNVGVASGVTFPDALSGGAFQAHFGGPILLSDPGVLPSPTSTYLTGSTSTIVNTTIFGGTAALSNAVQTQIGTALGL